MADICNVHEIKLLKYNKLNAIIYEILHHLKNQNQVSDPPEKKQSSIRYHTS